MRTAVAAMWFIVLLVFCPVSLAESGGELGVGVAVTDITPPVGYRLCGYFNERLSTGMHDPLHAKAVVFQQGKEKAAWVFCDLIGLSADASTRARKLASEKTGIPVSNIVVCATHSHTGPLYWGVLRDYFHGQAVAKQGKDPQEEVNYPELLVSRVAEAIVQAQGAVRGVRVEFGAASETRLSFNRRFHMKDGAVQFNPGKKNPNIVRVAGPIDPAVGVLVFRDAASAAAVASLTVFALHLDTVGGTEYSADYPVYLEATLRKTLGEGLISLFGNGTCGDINHIDVSHTGSQGGQDEAKRIGTTLGATVAAALPKLEPLRSPSMRMVATTLQVPMQTFSPEQIRQAQQDLSKVGTNQSSFIDQVTAYKIATVASRKGSAIPLEVQVLRLGNDVALVGLPGEVFADLGLAIKQASPFKTTLVIELCNDVPGYVPTVKAFKEGSYETVNSEVQPGGGEMLVEAATALLKQLHKG